MKKLIITKEYQGNLITFDLHSTDGIVNATQMAKPFEGKLPAGYLRLDSTQELIQAIIEDENERRIEAFQDGKLHLENEVQYVNSHTENSVFPNLMTYEDVVNVVNGGRKNGTWMHRLLAIDFAGWLNARFKVWMLRTIDEILFGRILEKRRRAEKAGQRRRRMRELENQIYQMEAVQELERLRKEEKADIKVEVDEYNDFVDLFTPQDDENIEDADFKTA